MHTNYAPNSLNQNQQQTVSEIGELHRKRGEVWLRHDAEAYLSYYWDDATLFAVDERLTVAQLRQWLIASLATGAGPITISLPPVEDIVISGAGDAATTSFAWRYHGRSAEGVEYDKSYYETNVWYRRNGVWKIIRMHLTPFSPASASAP